VKNQLLSLSPLDGRYAPQTAPLREYFSEFAYIRTRARLEIAYLITLAAETDLLPPFSSKELDFLRRLSNDFSLDDAEQVKKLERTTRHDLKAIENFLRDRLVRGSMPDCLPYLHFGLTSEDVNQTAQALDLKSARDFALLPVLDEIIAKLRAFALRYKATPMLARTHGQPAVPTTFGKEIAVFAVRLERERTFIAAHRFEAKWSGAVGNYNAQIVGAPQVDWVAFSEKFLRGFGLQPTPLGTQIAPYENWLRYFQAIQRVNGILLDLAQDMWRYISDGMLKLRVVQGEVGSSTMPQKVNPIDFENAEGNLGLANALFEQYIRKLPVSRLQRDLSDSTVRRSFGEAFGHTLVAWRSLVKGLNRVEGDEASLKSTLETHWEVVAEGAQTILRSAGIPSAYQMLKSLTRGKKMTEESYRAWAEGLDADESVKSRLLALAPQNYLGLAEKMTEQVLSEEK
jgi:adenylosuccinate lyase